MKKAYKVLIGGQNDVLFYQFYKDCHFVHLAFV